jgi:hypothetical protein
LASSKINAEVALKAMMSACVEVVRRSSSREVEIS